MTYVVISLSLTFVTKVKSTVYGIGPIYRTSVSDDSRYGKRSALAVARRPAFNDVRVADGDARAPPIPNAQAHCQNCTPTRSTLPERPRHTGTHRRKHRRAAAVCRGALGRDHTVTIRRRR